MFSCVVYKINKGKYKVEHTSDGSLEKGVYYKRIDDLPVDIQSKVKQLMWVPPDDQTMNETIGIRIGENIFWIV
jgi:hypothetical protein